MNDFSADFGDKMKGKLKRTLQTLTLLMVLLYTSLLAYQNMSHGCAQTSQVPGGANPCDGSSPPSHLQPRQSGRDSRAKRVPSYVVNSATSDVIPTVTATRKPPLTTLDDLFISVKTAGHYHYSRLAIILKTWFQLAKNQTWFFTDIDDEEFQQKTNGHMVNTNCPPTHSRKDLCCKMSAELDTFLESDKKWFCHFDDDNYVNVPRLVRFLADFNSQEDWYFGKTSIPRPMVVLKGKKSPKKVSFWFATGGAGFCLSRALALKMMPYTSRGKFLRMTEKIHLTDDVAMGYIIEHLLKKPLTVVNEFHSHLEQMMFIRRDTLHDQISFSYQFKNTSERMNVVKIDGFNVKYDPSRFLSLHCFLFPYFSFCPK